MDVYFTTVTYIFTAVFGLCIGSFLNVVIYRVPKKMSLAQPPSHCPNCNYQLRWYDNIPVLSYVLLGGKCRSCKQPISPRYMIVEIANMLLWILCVWRFWKCSIVYACLSAFVLSVCICIFCIDLEQMLIFDRFQLILAGLAVCSLFFDPQVSLLSHGIGCLIGGGSFFAIAFLSEKLLKKEGLGGGDIKLSAGMGLFLGWERWLLSVLIASVSASVILVFCRNKQKDEENREYPFGPFLTIGFAVALLFGELIINWYLNLLL